MKYSTLSFIISSSILLHACGSSNDIQNHTTDPKPNHNSQHQSNSHNINGNQSSNNSNQADNPSHNSNQQNNQNDFTPNISSGNAPNPKNNIIISSNNNDGDIETGLIIPLKEVKLDELTKEKLEEWIQNKNKRLGDEKAKYDAAENAQKAARTAVNTAKTAISGNLQKIADLEAAIAKRTNVDTNKAELAKVREETEKLNTAYQNALTQQIKATADFSVAKGQKSLAEGQESKLIKNANDFVEGKDIDPDLVVKYYRVYQEHKKLEADAFVARKNKKIAEQKTTDIESAIKALKSVNAEAEKIKAGKDYSGESKKVAEDVIAKNNAEIKKLEKEAQKAKEVAQSEREKEGIAKISKKENTDEEFKKLEKAVMYRGVYGDGAYPGNFKAIEEVTLDSNGTKWSLKLKDVEKPLEIDTSDNSYAHFRTRFRGFYKTTSEKTAAYGNLANNNGEAQLKSSIYGYDEDGKFFSVGKVAPSDATIEGTFSGHSFLTAKDNNSTPLTSKVVVTINPNKTLTGTLSEFFSYTKGQPGMNNPTDEFKNQQFIFNSDIVGNKFIPKKIEGQAEAYGYFYGVDKNNVNEMGGLLKHDKFEGAFGAKK